MCTVLLPRGVNPITVKKYIQYLAAELQKERTEHQAAICRTVSAQNVTGDRKNLTDPYQTNISACYVCTRI